MGWWYEKYLLVRKDNPLLKRLPFFSRIPGAKESPPTDCALENSRAGMASLPLPAHLKNDEQFVQDTYLWSEGMLAAVDSQPRR